MSDLGLYDSASELSSDFPNDSSDAESLLEPDAGEVDSPQQSRHEQSSATAASTSDQPNHEQSSSTAAQAAKAIEAAAESNTDVTLRDRLNAPTPQPTRLPSWPDEHTPLLDAGPAPPDYAAATAWRRALPSTHTEDVAVDVSSGPVDEAHISHDVADETVPLRQSSESIHTSTSLGSTKLRRAYNLRRRRCLQYFACICILVLFLISIFLTLPTPSRPRQRFRRITDLDHPNTSVCLFDRYSEYATFSFEDPQEFFFKDDGDFSFGSTDDEKEFVRMILTGDVNLFAAPATQEAALEVWMNVATTSPWEVAKLRVVEDWEKLAMIPPLLRKSGNRTNDANDTSDPCVHTWIGIFVQPDSMLNFLKISAGYMNVSLGYMDPMWKIHGESEGRQVSPLDLHTLDLTVLTKAEGIIDSGFLLARKANLNTIFGSIKGTYALHDEIFLKSRTGAVNITVHPKMGDGSGQAPANFTVRSDWHPFHFHWPTFEPADIRSENSSILVDTSYGWGDGNIPSGYINITWKELSV